MLPSVKLPVPALVRGEAGLPDGDPDALSRCTGDKGHQTALPAASRHPREDPLPAPGIRPDGFVFFRQREHQVDGMPVPSRQVETGRALTTRRRTHT
jgi:hypothetical protein